MAMNADTSDATMVKKQENSYKSWMKEIGYALTREKDFRKQADKCVGLYEAKTPEQTPFAILYSNVETMSPALYNSRPVPIVQRKFKDEDPVAKAAAEVATRSLKYLVEADSADYDSFDEIIPAAVTDVLVTNRGVCRAKFVMDGDKPCVFGESVRWDKFFHGYARTWKKVPFIGFEWDMTKEEVQENFKDIPIEEIDFDSIPGPDDQDENGNKPLETRQEMTGVKLAKVYEIWDKDSRMVMFFSPCYKAGPLKAVPDPLKLAGFFPIPKPLNLFRKTSTLVPTPLYIQYEQQAQELNDITVRLKKLIKALKVRGIYNSTISGIDQLLAADDNTLIPAEEMASLPDGTGADKLIWLMPLGELITTIQQLYQQREQVKQVIYEITGVSDILRGSSVASETATAQNLKNQWGTLRLKKMQKEIQRFCREMLAIMLEIAASKFPQESIQAMTGMDFPTQQKKDQAQQQIQMLTAEAEQLAMMAPEGAPPPPPPQIPPEVQSMLAKPSWEEIIGLLRNDVLRSYRVDIETNSTIDAEAAQDKQDISELMNSIAQFLNGVAPLVEKGILSIDIAKGMLLTVSRRYTFGSQLEDAIMQMKAPEPESDPAAEAKNAAAQAQLQLTQIKAQAEQAKIQAEMQKMQAELAAATQMAELERQVRMEELRNTQAELQMKAAFAKAQHEMKMASLAAKMQTDAAKAKESVPMSQSN